MQATEELQGATTLRVVGGSVGFPTVCLVVSSGTALVGLVQIGKLAPPMDLLTRSIPIEPALLHVLPAKAKELVDNP